MRDWKLLGSGTFTSGCLFVCFFFTVTVQNRRVLALLRALVSRCKNTSLFELPQADNISCFFQPVHVPSEKEIWTMDQIMSFGL